jgi:hypothetical protein
MRTDSVASTTTPVDPLAKALGLINWACVPSVCTGSGALTGQKIYMTPVYIPPGTVVTSIVLSINQVGTGTAPTGFFVGLTDGATMLAQSSNLNGSTSLTAATGMAPFALSSTYTTVTASGWHGVVMLINSGFGTQNVQFLRQPGVVGSVGPITGSSLLAGASLGTGQTVLPGNGAAVTLTVDAAPFWAAVK